MGPPPVLAPRFSAIALLKLFCRHFFDYFLRNLYAIFMYSLCTLYTFFVTHTLCFSVLASMLVLTLFSTAIGEL
jgi:hypothetical protein